MKKITSKKLSAMLMVMLICIVVTSFTGCDFHGLNMGMEDTTADETYPSDIKVSNGTESSTEQEDDTTRAPEEQPVLSGTIGDISINESATVTNNETAFTKTIAKAAKSVVEINTETASYSQWSGQYIITGAGSGVIIAHNEDRTEYYVVTNNHVIEGAQSILVRLSDGTEYDKTKTRLIATDIITDVALLAITTEKGTELPTAVIMNERSTLVDGQDVFVIGNPLGELGGSVTKGIISKTERTIMVGGVNMRLLQIDASVNPGNSGGGLFDMDGNLIGIVNAKYTDESVEGIGFAIPVSTVKSVVASLAKYGYVGGRPGLGFDTLDRSYNQNTIFSSSVIYPTVTGTTSAVGRYTNSEGVTENYNFKENDVISAVNGQTVNSTAALMSALCSYEIGDTVTLTVHREEKVVYGYQVYYTYVKYEVEVKLIEHVPSTVG